MDNNFHSTIQGKAMKFKAFTQILIKFKLSKRNSQENILIDKLNDAINDSELENSSQSFEICDFKKVFNLNSYKGTIFFHMDISSLPCSFDQLHTLLSELNISFNATRIAETCL